MDDFPELPELVEKVEECLELGLYDEGLKQLDQHADFFKDEWEIHFLYSRIHLEQNNPDAAIRHLHDALRLDKNNVDCLLGLFYAHSQLGQLKKCGKYLLRAEKSHPDNEPVLSGLIWYCTETNELDKALAYFEKARSLGSDNPETFRNGGLAYQRIGNYPAAESCFVQALRLNPQYDDVRDLLADLYMLTGDFEKSVSLYREHLKISPNNIRALSRLVFCLSQGNQTKEALTLAEETIRLYPNSPVGYVDCAYVHLNVKAYDKAVALAEKALDVSPIDAEALRVKGIAFSEQGRDSEARKAFDASLALEPHNPEIMRDYYHHLRNVSDFDKMEKMVDRVVKQEYPYCIEDFWFLADYYRDSGDNLKAFHFLHKAYTNMPGEKELIPPMLNILFDAGHILYSVPFMMRYIERSGWNDVMNQFARHKRLKDTWSQEGLRFMRFYGQNTPQFRKFIFLVYVEKFLFFSLILLLPVAAALAFSLKGWIAAVWTVVAGAGILAAEKTIKYLLAKRVKTQSGDTIGPPS